MSRFNFIIYLEIDNEDDCSFVARSNQFNLLLINLDIISRN
jgi:hypothetical protein